MTMTTVSVTARAQNGGMPDHPAPNRSDVGSVPNTSSPSWSATSASPRTGKGAFLRREGPHQTQGPQAGRVLRPLRGARHLYALCGCLARGPERIRGTGHRFHRRRRARARDRSGPADHPRRPGQLDDVEPGGRTPQLLGHQALTQPSPRKQRQPLQRGPIQDAQVLPELPRTLRLDRRRPRVLRVVLLVVNHEHRHSGIGYHTPASVHYGTAQEVRAQRKETLDAAYATNPARFRHRKPEPPKLPTIAWINEPVSEVELAQKAS